ncbi:RNA-directed DNA polymerase, eukaryota, reverse transcriptase zinc-binding domain protein [Tanacetum coccineum]
MYRIDGPTLNTKNNQGFQSNKEGKQVRDTNSFAVVRDLEDDNIQGLNMLKDKMIVDKYLNMKLQPSFNMEWRDLLEDYSEAAENLVPDEVNGIAPKLKKVCETVYGQWEWISNISQCNGSCRITVGWNSDVVQLAKCITNGCPWILMRDFNVTLKLEEHSAGKSTISNDMQEFIDCVNRIEVEDVCMTGMFYTQIKSPSSPSTSILKKLDRVMANEEFISK